MFTFIVLKNAIFTKKTCHFCCALSPALPLLSMLITCDGRHLSDIPADVPRSALLLSATHNNLTRLGRSDLSGFDELQTLRLGFNRISYIESGTFLHSAALTFISKDAFGPLKNLQELHLPSNKLTQISDVLNALYSCPLLQVVNLGDNRFTSLESKNFLFPLNITDLDLGSNPLRKFTLHQNVFPHLKSLSLSKIDEYHLQWDVSDDSFLQNLRTLDLSGTNFTTEAYKSIFRSLRSLEDLNVSLKTGRGVLDFACGIPSLRKLDLSVNLVSVLNDSLLQPCSGVTHLDLSNNVMKNMSQSSLRALRRLSWLNLTMNSLPRVPSAIGHKWNLKLLSLSSNVITHLECSDFSGLWHLTELVLSDNRLFELNYCVFEHLLSLQKLYIERNFLYTFENSFTFTLRNLLVLNAEGNIDILYEGVFRVLPRLRELTVGKGIIMNDGVFEGLRDLRYLSYSPGFLNGETGAGLELASGGPDPKILTPLGDLRKLDLSENHLQSLDLISEANLTKLERLILTNNELKIIDEHVFDSLPSLKYLDLSGNLFVCNCSNAGFIQWVLSNKQVYVARAFQYRCAYPLSHQGELLLSFNVRSCWESEGLICFVTSSFLVLVTLLSSFVYHFLRWQLVYGYFLFRARLYDRKKKREGSTHVYDAFVSYNVHDEEWVYHHLVPELEERQGWKLCLHHRDFEPVEKYGQRNNISMESSGGKSFSHISEQVFYAVQWKNTAKGTTFPWNQVAGRASGQIRVMFVEMQANKINKMKIKTTKNVHTVALKPTVLQQSALKVSFCRSLWTM
uniref:TIR domain-containing protein n=1 Tax=Periophthalmus magnuspinnatus TaxID=409849 RepID=A0A3B4A8L4_9GOBI